MRRTLDETLATWAEDARVLERNGHRHDAQLIDRVLDSVREAARDYLTWLSESEAMLRSGRKVDFFRARFPEWASEGMAELRGRQRYYRQVIVPQRAHASAAYLAGLRGERSA
jgi:hypothetical protein